MKKQVTVEMWSFKLPSFLNKLLVLLLLSISSFQTMAQTGTVTGKVLDDKGEPIIGATIEVIDAFKKNIGGTLTDMDGNYSIEVKDMNLSSLKFSFLGNKTQTILVKGQTIIDTKLAEDSEVLAEVVAIGYGTKTVKEVTEAISQVSAKEMALTVNTNIENALSGRAAGVQISQNSGAPGASSNVRIRGQGSFTFSEPLYVIDGVPVGTGGLNLINPSDIQTMDVLKDASAAAIYGARGANGVVIITTKRGKSGKNRVNFEASYGLQNAWKKLPVLNSSQFKDLYTDAYSRTAKSLNLNLSPSYDNKNNPNYNTDTDWQKQIFRTGNIQNYNLSMSGGSDLASYSFSGGYFKNDGIVINSAFERYTARVNSDYRLKKWLNIGQSLTLAKTITTKSGRDVMTNAALTSPYVGTDDVIITPEQHGAFNWPNPVALSNASSNKIDNYRALGNAYVEILPFKGLKYRLNIGGDITMGKDYTSSSAFFSGQAAVYKADLGARNVSDNRSFNNMTLLENTLTYTDTIGKFNYFQVLAGTSQQTFYESSLNGLNQNMPNGITSVGYQGKATVSGAFDDLYALRSYLGRIIYTFKDKYLFTGNINYNGSSKFGSNNRYGVFPSLSVGWRPLEETFIKAASFVQKGTLSDFKIRGSWGITGNQEPLQPGRIYVQMNDRPHYVFGDKQDFVSGVIPEGIANRGLKWEQVTQSNIGFDFGIFKNRITGTVDYFIKNTVGALIRVPLPISSGFQPEGGTGIFSVWSNQANLTNKGIELALNYNKYEGKFTYSIGGNITKIKNEVTKIGDDNARIFNDPDNNPSVVQVGSPFGSFYGYKMDGIFQNQSEIDNYAAQASTGVKNLTSPGDVRFQDVSGSNGVADGKVSPEDRVIIGNSIPNFTYGGNISAEYMGFDFKLFAQGVSGVSVYNNYRKSLESMGASSPDQNQLTTVLDRWTKEGSSNTMPRAIVNDPNGNTRISSRWVENASYFRLKNIQLGYSLPKSAMSKILKSEETTLRIYVSAQNLWTITKYSGYDPEISTGYDKNNPNQQVVTSGVDGGSYPQARTYLIGFQFGF